MSDIEAIRECAYKTNNLKEFVELLGKKNRELLFDLAYEIMEEIRWEKGWKNLLDDLELTEV